MTHAAVPAMEAGSVTILPVAPAWAKRKGWNARMAAALPRDASGARTGADLRRCADRLGIRLAYVEGDALAMPVTSAHFCHHRLCPVCSWRKASAWRRRLIPGLEAFHVDHPKHVPLLLTLTVRNCRVEELRETVGQLHQGWERLSRARWFPTEFWLRRTELTVGRPPAGDDVPPVPRRRPPVKAQPKTDSQHHDITQSESVVADSTMPLWVHPHLHALLLVPPRYFTADYVRQSRWQQEWAMAARLDYAPVVDIRRGYVRSGDVDPHRSSIAAALEAAKYVGKPVDFLHHPHAVVPVEEQIKHLRMIGVSRPLGAYVRHGPLEQAELLDAQGEADTGQWSSEVFASWDDSAAAYFFDS